MGVVPPCMIMAIIWEVVRYVILEKERNVFIFL